MGGARGLMDLIGRGVIDPTKVVRTAIQDAASIAGLLITTEAMIAEALAEPVQAICEAVMIALEATPPDLAADIVDRGVMLSGVGAMLGEMDLALREQTGLSISIADQPMNCVALGTGKALEYEKQLRHVIDYDS